MSNGTRVLVTGSEGFIASHLLNILRKRKYATKAYGIRIGYDVLNQHQLEEVVLEFKPTWIIHLAQRNVEVNVAGTANVLECAYKHGCGVTFTSSASVYGNSSNQQLEPLTAYAVSKVAAELFCRFYHDAYGLPMVIFRFSSIYGSRAKTAINTITAKILKNEVIQINGNGLQTRDYTHVSDIVEALIMSAHGKFPDDTYDIGTGTQTSINHVVKIVEALLGKKAIMQHVPDSATDAKRNILDVAKALSCGFKAKVSLKQGLRKLVEEMNNA